MESRWEPERKEGRKDYNYIITLLHEAHVKHSLKEIQEKTDLLAISVLFEAQVGELLFHALKLRLGFAQVREDWDRWDGMAGLNACSRLHVREPP